MEVKMLKQLKSCPLCGSDIGVQIIAGENCNGKVYRGICWRDQCKHKLPSDWYEKRKEAVVAWNSLKSNDIARMNCDYERIPNDLLQKSAVEIINTITRHSEFDQTVLKNKI
jgi:hypothetical protein